MKISCDVIRDLLPLYVENMLSNDSVSMVKDHLVQCEQCKIYLKDMESGAPIPANSDDSPLLKIKSTLWKKRVQTMLFSTFIAIIIFVISMLYLTAPDYHYYGDESVKIHEVENGILLAKFSDKVYGYDIDKYEKEDGTGYVYSITTWDSLWNSKIKKSNKDSIILNPNGEKVVSVYFYQAYGDEDKLMYGENLYGDGGVKTLPRLTLTYYAFIALILAIICGVIMFIFRGNKKIVNNTLKIFLLPASYLLAHSIVTGFTRKYFNVFRNLYAILLLTILLYIAYLMASNYIVNCKRKEL